MAENETATESESETTAIEPIDISDLESLDLEKLKEVVSKERQMRRDAESGVPRQPRDPLATAAIRKAAKESDDLRTRLKEYEDRDKTETQKLQEERDALFAERDSLRSETLRREVADAKGLTPAQARRLIGATREELEADADDIAATFPTTTPAAPFTDVGQGHRGETAARIYRQSELKDHAFFTENKADILAASKEGRITPD